MTSRPAPTARLLGATAAVLLLAGTGFVLGLSGPNAVAVGLAVVTGFGLRHLPDVDPAQGWPEHISATDKGARREVSRLSWSLQGYESRVERGSVRRLQQIASARLAERGLQLAAPEDTAACRELLGDTALRVLRTQPGQRAYYDEFLAAVTAVEQLVTDGLRSSR